MFTYVVPGENVLAGILELLPDGLTGCSLLLALRASSLETFIYSSS